MKKLILISIFISFFLIGCTEPYQAILEPSNNYYKRVTKKRDKHPTLGIALSGGGSKAAPFAMGVLKRFVDKGWIDSVDMISSVSGGGYSAYYLYSKAIYIDKHKDKNLRNFFESCELREDIPNSTSYQEYNSALKECDKTEYGKYQRYVRKYQDLLSFVQSETARGATHLDDIKATGTFVGGMASSVVTAPVHHVANSLFDWKVELSPTQYLYEKGIIRAFGKMPNEKLSEHKNETFKELRELSQNNSTLPLWIINASNFKKTWLQDAFKSNLVDLNATVFEITPYGFGSMEHNYSLKSPDKLGLDLPRATLASAAFLDALGDKWYQGLAFGGLHALNMRWGVKIPNYSSSIDAQKRHNLLPFPFYYTDMNNSKITLADGGQSGDNLGVYSLIKRGVKNIVIVSASHDATKDKLKLEDMCSVSRYLEDKNMTVWFNGRPSKREDETSLRFYNEFCQKENNLYHRISYYDWKKPIWKGYVKHNGETISTLYYIKAAIDIEDLNKSANKVANDNRIRDNGKYYDRDNIPYKDFIQKDGYKNNPSYKYHYPYSLAYFWQENSYGKKASHFPQTSTVTNTLNSSQNLYQAYMDLGFYLSGYLMEDEEFLNAVKEQK